MDIHKIIALLQRHWVDLILLPANILTIEAIVRQAAVNKGYTKMVTWCDHIANFVSFLQDIIVGLLQRKPTIKPPAAAVIILFCLLATPVNAQTVSIGDVLTQAKAKEGMLYDFKAQRGLNFLATTVYEKGKFSVLAGLVSTDGIGVAADYDIGTALPKVNFPALNLVNYLHVGVGGYVRTTTFLTDSTQTTKDDNKLGFGPTVFVKWNF